MINQEFKTQGRKYQDQVLPIFGICCREQGGSKLRVFSHVCAVSASSIYRIITLMRLCMSEGDVRAWTIVN